MTDALIEQRLNQLETKRMTQKDYINRSVKPRHVDGLVITPGLAADLPSGNTDVQAYFATDTNVLYLWNGSSWVSDVWVSYTPIWTCATGSNPVLGDGVMTGKYCVQGRTVHVSITLTMGSTTTYGSGIWQFSLPFTSANSTNMRWFFPVYGKDTGTAFHTGVGFIVANSAVTTWIQTENSSGNWSAANPHTWASTDELGFTAAYEI